MITGFNGILSVTVFLPALAALLIWLVAKSDSQDRLIAVTAGVCDLVLAAVAFALFKIGAGAVRFKFVDRID